PSFAPLSPIILGLSGLTPLRLFAKARRLGLWEGVVRAFRPASAPHAAPVGLPSQKLIYGGDDDQDPRDALSELLTSRGAKVVVFSDELALYGAVARRPPSAILLDVVLPWVDGLRLCQGLTSHPSTAHTPIYVISGLNRPYIQKGALAA